MKVLLLIILMSLAACDSSTANRAKIVGPDGEVHGTRSTVCIDGVVYMTNPVEMGYVYTVKMTRESKVELCKYP